MTHPPPSATPKRPRPNHSGRPSLSCRAGGNHRPCAYPSTPPRLAAGSRNRGLSLNLSVAPRKARYGHAAGAMFDFRWENDISARRFSQTVFPGRPRGPACAAQDHQAAPCAGPDPMPALIDRAPAPASASPLRTAPSRPLSAYLNFFSKQLFASRRLLFISPPHRRVAQRCDPLLGNSSTVERRTLTPLILVRIQVPQPISLPNENQSTWPRLRTAALRSQRTFPAASLFGCLVPCRAEMMRMALTLVSTGTVAPRSGRRRQACGSTAGRNAAGL